MHPQARLLLATLVQLPVISSPSSPVKVVQHARYRLCGEWRVTLAEMPRAASSFDTSRNESWPPLATNMKAGDQVVLAHHKPAVTMCGAGRQGV
jgi:hypothetical protein